MSEIPTRRAPLPGDENSPPPRPPSHASRLPLGTQCIHSHKGTCGRKVKLHQSIKKCKLCLIVLSCLYLPVSRGGKKEPLMRDGGVHGLGCPGWGINSDRSFKIFY